MHRSVYTLIWKGKAIFGSGVFANGIGGVKAGCRRQDLRRARYTPNVLPGRFEMILTCDFYEIFMEYWRSSNVTEHR